jgi:hypothetical protein
VNRNDPLLEQIIQLKKLLRDLFLRHYLNYELLSWVWWVGIACIIIPFLIWWKVVDKKRLLEICLFGLIVNVSCCFLDVMGSELVLWEYPIHILPQIPLLFPVDFVIVPVIKMIVYQKCPRWGKYLIWSTVTAAFLAFVAEPLAIWIGEYKLITWKLIYSFPVYIGINAFAKLVTDGLKKRQLRG